MKKDISCVPDNSTSILKKKKTSRGKKRKEKAKKRKLYRRIYRLARKMKMTSTDLKRYVTGVDHGEAVSSLGKYLPMVILGCLSATNINDIVTVNLVYPTDKLPTNIQQQYPRGNNTPFSSTVKLSADTQIYNISMVANGYTNVNLSQEGLLWTLWPLAKPNENAVDPESYTYFENFVFGTALQSRYLIGQIGSFFQSINLGCTIIGSKPNTRIPGTDLLEPGVPSAQPGLHSSGLAYALAGMSSTGLAPGVQGLEETIIDDIGQQIAIVVIKVTEEIARIYNPIASASSDNRFIYVGYDGWSIVRMSSNPVGPLAAQTYITPQSVTGGITGDNFQVVFPPNFTHSVFFKNQGYNIPI